MLSLGKGFLVVMSDGPHHILTATSHTQLVSTISGYYCVCNIPVRRLPVGTDIIREKKEVGYNFKYCITGYFKGY